MIREYNFAALVYDEQEHAVRCAACGRAVNERKCIYKSGGRWCCGKCISGLLEPPTECALCSTAKAAAEQ